MYGSWDIKHDRHFFVILGYFLPFYPPNNQKKNSWRYYHFMHEHHKYKFVRYGVRQSIFFLISGYFLPFYPPHSLKNENFKKMEKMLGDKILLKCTKTHDHKLYCSWDMACDGCNCCFLFWAIFCPFTHLTLQKMKISKKWKKTPGDILHNCTKSYDYRLYCSWDMACDGCHCYFSFWAIFCTFTP